MGVKPFLSVIIPTFNRIEKLERTLKALQKQTLNPSSFEVIVIDDGSSDESLDVLHEAKTKWPNLRVFHQENSGQGSARNKGINYAEGQVILFIGDDIIPTEDFLERHVQFHEERPDVHYACLGLTEWYPSEPITPFMDWMTHGGPQFAYYRFSPGQTVDYKFFYTSNVSLKSILLKNDLFDTNFHGYGWEDIELAYRLYKKFNLQIIYKPEALAYHSHFIEEKSLEKRMLQIGRNAKVFANKCPGIDAVPHGMKYFISLIITSWSIYWISKIMRNIAPSLFQRKFWWISSKRYFLKGLKSL